MNRISQLSSILPGYADHNSVSWMLSILGAHPAAKAVAVPPTATLPERIELLENAVLAAAGVTSEPKTASESAAAPKTGSARAEASIQKYLSRIAPRPMAQAEIKTPYGRAVAAIEQALARK